MIFFNSIASRRRGIFLGCRCHLSLRAGTEQKVGGQDSPGVPKEHTHYSGKHKYQLGQATDRRHSRTTNINHLKHFITVRRTQDALKEGRPWSVRCVRLSLLSYSEDWQKWNEGCGHLGARLGGEHGNMMETKGAGILKQSSVQS